MEHKLEKHSLRTIMLTLSLGSAPLAVLAGGTVDGDYVRSLSAPGKAVLVVEYYDPQGNPVERRGYARVGGFQSRSPVEIAVDENTIIHLYGIEPCAGELHNEREGFHGNCDDYARQQLDVLLGGAKVVFCRAFLTEISAQRQDGTCFIYTHYPGALDAVTNLEEQLLSVGALRLSRKPDGALMRPDLADAERIGRLGYGMWTDPRVKGPLTGASEPTVRGGGK